MLRSSLDAKRKNLKSANYCLEMLLNTVGLLPRVRQALPRLAGRLWLLAAMAWMPRPRLASLSRLVIPLNATISKFVECLETMRWGANPMQFERLALAICGRFGGLYGCGQAMSSERRRGSRGAALLAASFTTAVCRCSRLVTTSR